MLIRAVSLAKGHSGFSEKSLMVLLNMINEDIIPEIPCHGSLGASGDLAYFARLGRAMLKDPVYVVHKGVRKTADQALDECGIEPFKPLSKEGLALINGTSFMASMLAIAMEKELKILETSMGLQALFLNSVGALESAFLDCIQEVRKQEGQKDIAKILLSFLYNSPFTNRNNVQDDYSIRCLPQIIGPKLELILSQAKVVERELNAVTDNPLIFLNEEISDAIHPDLKMEFEGDQWAILSCGNFHGEYQAVAADAIATANAKIALTFERQITYCLNPKRNQFSLPCYLIKDASKKGLMSGLMITQYTANAVSQKIAQLGIPASIFNITSANESEDIVSYGATAGMRLLEQLEYMEQLNAIYATVVMQAYALKREEKQISSLLISEHIFILLQKKMENSFPILTDTAFDQYDRIRKALDDLDIPNLINRPFYCRARGKI